MIKLDIVPNCSRYFNNHLRTLLRLEFELKRLNITLSCGDGDVQLLQIQKNNAVIKHFLDNGKPTIIQDIYLGPELLWWNIRDYVPRDNVKVVLKTAKFADKSLYDIRFWRHLKHVSVIAGNTETSQYPGKMSDFYDKLVVFSSIIAWDYFQNIEFPPLDLRSDKKFDTSIVLGEIGENYPIEETRTHRFAALDAVYRLRDQRDVFVKMPHDPEIPRERYNHILLNSKTCLSPWGYDVTCWRDFEAAVNGAVVIRPDTSFSTSWPEIPYVTCAADFSDFQEVLDNIINNYDDFDEMRMRAYSNAMSGMDNKVLAKRLARIVESCLE